MEIPQEIIEIWQDVKQLLDIKYMFSLFFVSLYLYRFSPWVSFFENRKKNSTLAIGILLGAVFVSFKYFEIGIKKELWLYHFYLGLSFAVTTSLYENLAYYLIKKLNDLTGKENV